MSETPNGASSPTDIAQWATRATEQEIAQAAGKQLSRQRIRDCVRLWRELHPDLMWLIDSGQITVSMGIELCQLPDGRERFTLAAAVIHENQETSANLPVKRIRAVVRERLAHPEQTIEEVMDRVAGMRFDAKPTFLHLSEDVPSMYAAAWQWRDRSIGDYISKAPERLAQLTTLLEQATATTTLRTEDGATLEVRLTMNAHPGGTQKD